MSVIVSVVARTRKQEGDAIARLTDASEDALRQFVDFPNRLAVRSRDDLRDRISQIAIKVRAIDPLVARVSKLEKRVDALERKTTKPSKRKAPTRRKSAQARPEVVSDPLHEAEPTTEATPEAVAEGTPKHEPEHQAASEALRAAADGPGGDDSSDH